MISSNKEMLLEIITPLGVFLSQKTTYIKAPGAVGEFGILSGHIPFYSVLKTGILEYQTDIKNRVSIKSGVLECVRNKITIIAESAETL